MIAMKWIALLLPAGSPLLARVHIAVGIGIGYGGYGYAAAPPPPPAAVYVRASRPGHSRILGGAALLPAPLLSRLLAPVALRSPVKYSRARA